MSPTSWLSCLIKDGRDILILIFIKPYNKKFLITTPVEESRAFKFASVSSTYKNVDESITSYIQESRDHTTQRVRLVRRMSTAKSMAMKLTSSMHVFDRALPAYYLVPTRLKSVDF